MTVKLLLRDPVEYRNIIPYQVVIFLFNSKGNSIQREIKSKIIRYF